MKKILLPLFVLCLGLLIPGIASAAATHEDLQDRVDAAKIVLDQILNTPDNSIPLNILEQATCVAVTSPAPSRRIASILGDM